MSFGIQPAGVVEGGVLHAQLGGPGIHALHKGRLTAAHQLRHCHGGVIGRGHADGLDHLIQRELLPGFQPDLTAAHMVGVLAHRHRCFQCELPVVDGFKGQQQGHHLGDGSNGHLLIGVFFVQYRTGVLIHQNGRPAVQAQLRLRRSVHHRDIFHRRRGRCGQFRLHRNAPALCRAEGQRKQPEAQDPRAQQCQISPFHSGPLPARSRLLQCMRQTARKCPVVKSRFCALERAAGQNPLLHCGAALLYNE